MLGSYVEITLHASAPVETLNDWITTGFEAIAEVDRLMSVHCPESDVAQLNRAEPGEWIEANPLTIQVLKASNELWAASKGVFDIRCSVYQNGVRPSGVPLNVVRHNVVQKTGPWTFDLGGIAKGFAVDRAVQAIQRLSRGRGVSGIVNAGGDLRRWGMAARAVAVATSAVRTPENQDLLSSAIHRRMPQGEVFKRKKAVTVWSDRCLWSDALTKVVLMGSQPIARACLSAYRAQAIVFGQSGSPVRFVS
jgi:thiamine biosynthesis lipoprotein